MTDLKTKIEEYAELIVNKGLALQKGQTVLISVAVECADFARACVRQCYRAGCKDVIVQWTDDFMTRERYLHAEDSVFDTVHEFQGVMYDNLADIKAARLAITGSDPENLLGVDPSRIQRSQRASGKRFERYFHAQTTNEFQWCVAACPTAAWAKKVFPDIDGAYAIGKLWDAIFRTVRVMGDGQAVSRWTEHTALSKSRVAKLNEYNLKALKYKNGLGTDFTVELPAEHFWTGASEHASTGVEFIANMPTEEVFTVPKRDGVNGTIVSAMPLVLNGNIVDKFKLTLEGGKIVKAEAEVGQEYLQNALSVDEGASYLGEVALVPYDSPISKSGILFYNTLFDENASCHMAFGEGYPCVAGADKLSADEQKKLGINQSYVHVDFMIGTSDLDITGVTADGREIPVFTAGNFAF